MISKLRMKTHTFKNYKTNTKLKLYRNYSILMTVVLPIVSSGFNQKAIRSDYYAKYYRDSDFRA